MRQNLLTVLSLVALVAACGKDSPSGPGGGGGVTLVNGTFNGSVNGASYQPTSAFMSFNGTIVALGAADAQGRALGFAFFATGPGTYTFSSSVGNNANYSEGGMGWNGGVGIGSGTATFTTLTLERAVGTFSFTLQPASGGATGTKTISGSFNITY
jgi:hypothetical protein